MYSYLLLLIKVFLVTQHDQYIRNNSYRSAWLGWPLWNICVTNDHGYVPLIANPSRSIPHSWLITGFV